MRMAQTERIERKRGKFQLDSAPERNDISRIAVILRVGFGLARHYGDLSRDRWTVALKDGKSLEQLQDFCAKHLKGSAVPGYDPIQDGPVLLKMFQAAEKRGIVSLEFQKAERFLPEKGI